MQYAHLLLSHNTRAVVGLAALIAALALIAAGAGLFWQDAGSPFTFTTLRGETVAIYGRGLYRFDTRFMGAGNRGTDAVTLALGIPLLIMATLRYRRGSLRWGLLLVGTLVYFFYVYASLALNAACNDLFLIYVALFSASLFAVVLIYASIDLVARQAYFLPSLPRRGPALFMFASGLVTLLIWLAPLLSALFQGQPPKLLGSSTTMVTDALDLGIITPATIIAGVLILRRAPLGYLIACSLLAPMIAAQTVSQIAAGVSIQHWSDVRANRRVQSARAGCDHSHRCAAAHDLGFSTGAGDTITAGPYLKCGRHDVQC